MATRLFIEKHFKLNPNFLSVSTKYFLSDIKGEDFENNPEGSRVGINEWAEEKTNHKIKNLLPEGNSWIVCYLKNLFFVNDGVCYLSSPYL